MKFLCIATTLLLSSVMLTAAAADTVRLTVTTSTDNSGLIQSILPNFERATGIRVQVVAAGTGRALQIGRRGDTDALLVHAREQELAFMHTGYGDRRREVMFNDFIIVGPATDPARIAAATTVTAALATIAATATGTVGTVTNAVDTVTTTTDTVTTTDATVTFISRGDQSGTHHRELSLWRTAGVTPTGDWYKEAGQGMGKVLLIASELGAYTLVDRGTWLAYRDRVTLRILSAGDDALRNVYSVITINPKKNPHVNHVGARKLLDWFTSRAGQRAIAEFRIGGEVLFHPLVHPR